MTAVASVGQRFPLTLQGFSCVWYSEYRWSYPRQWTHHPAEEKDIFIVLLSRIKALFCHTSLTVDTLVKSMAIAGESFLFYEDMFLTNQRRMVVIERENPKAPKAQSEKCLVSSLSEVAHCVLETLHPLANTKRRGCTSSSPFDLNRWQYLIFLLAAAETESITLQSQCRSLKSQLLFFRLYATVSQISSFPSWVAVIN